MDSWGRAGLTILGMAVAMTASTAAAQIILPPGRAPTECITRLQLLEGTTTEACAAARNDERDRLQAEGLADAAQVLVVTARGQILRGMTTASLTGGRGRVEATDGTLTCLGEYKSDQPSRVIVFPVRCTDGRTGVATRTSFFLDQGEGTIRMSDGEVARFAFGCATFVGDVRTCPVAQAAHINPPPSPAQPH